MHKFVFTTIAGTACLLAAAGVFAEDNGVRSDSNNKVASVGSFVALDRNGDHRISRSEAGFDRVLSQTFAEIDTDGDGFVSTTEFVAAEKTRTAVTNLSSR